MRDIDAARKHHVEEVESLKKKAKDVDAKFARVKKLETDNGGLKKKLKEVTTNLSECECC